MNINNDYFVVFKSFSYHVLNFLHCSIMFTIFFLSINDQLFSLATEIIDTVRVNYIHLLVVVVN